MTNCINQILSLLCVCFSTFVFGQTIQPLPQKSENVELKKTLSQKNKVGNLKLQTATKSSGSANENTSAGDDVFYASTIVFRQEGQQMVKYTLSQKDYHAVQKEKEKLEEVNVALKSNSLSASERKVLETKQVNALANYKSILNSSIQNLSQK